MTENAQTAATKKCRYCASEIPIEAVLCTECGRYQNWRRLFTTTSTFLSLLVALISVTVVGIPQLIDSMQPSRATLSIAFRSNEDNRASFIVYNLGNVAGALEPNATLFVPTEYQPFETGTDELLTSLAELTSLDDLPFDRIDLKMAPNQGDDAIVEADESRHFEFVAMPVTPWEKNFEIKVTVEQLVKIRGLKENQDALMDSDLFFDPEPGEDETDANSSSNSPNDELQLVSNTLIRTRRVITPLDQRIWNPGNDSPPCLLTFVTLDVTGQRTDQELALDCARVTPLIALLPSRVRVEHITEDDDDFGLGASGAFEHVLVQNGEAVDWTTMNVNFTLRHEVRMNVEQDIESLFEDDSIF